MRQVQVVAPGRLAFIDQPEPPLGPHDVKLRVAYSGLSARSEIERYQRNPADQPEPIGYNVVGTVTAIGDSVSLVRSGERVFATPGHADVAIVDETRVIPVPAAVDDERACFAYLPTLGTHALRRAGYQPGEYVAIIGQGIIGQTSGLAAHAYGARTIAVDVSDTRLRLAAATWADHTVNPTAADPAAAIAAICGDAGLDLVIDTASSWRSLCLALDLIRPLGRVVLLGIIRDPPDPAEAAALFAAYRRNLHRKEAAIFGTGNDAHDPWGQTGARFTWTRNVTEMLELMAAGRVDVGPLITHRYPISELEAVYQRLLAGDTDHLGVVFTWPAAMELPT